MKIPTIHGFIDRRILINYTADPDVVAKILPYPFKPQLFNGKAIVGICLIRLKNIKPKGFFGFCGVNSENGAHRIAVEWDDHGITKTGVYIPRRDTSLKLNAVLGGRVFPGKHYYAQFQVDENQGDYNVSFISSDKTEIAINATEIDEFQVDSVFESLDCASCFFENGEVGYSPNQEKFDGVRLKIYNWEVKPLKVKFVKSSFFENEQIFPQGSIHFDHALIMKNMEHEWVSEVDL